MKKEGEGNEDKSGLGGGGSAAEEEGKKEVFLRIKTSEGFFFGPEASVTCSRMKQSCATWLVKGSKKQRHQIP
jgi:hypothetical protein